MQFTFRVGLRTVNGAVFFAATSVNATLFDASGPSTSALSTVNVTVLQSGTELEVLYTPPASFYMATGSLFYGICVSPSNLVSPQCISGKAALQQTFIPGAAVGSQSSAAGSGVTVTSFSDASLVGHKRMGLCGLVGSACKRSLALAAALHGDDERSTRQHGRESCRPARDRYFCTCAPT